MSSTNGKYLSRCENRKGARQQKSERFLKVKGQGDDTDHFGNLEIAVTTLSNYKTWAA